MARPRKDSSMPDAREALMAAFWKLLEKNQLHEISVGMITNAAGCNRGTFYYHFPDKDALVAAAVENELRDIPRYIFALASGLEEIEYADIIADGHVSHIALFMERGGRNIVEPKVRDYLVQMWSALLSPEGGKITTETRIILAYMSSGILGLISCLATIGPDALASFPAKFLKDYSSLALGQICQAQHVDRDEIMARLRMVDQVTKVNRG